MKKVNWFCRISLAVAFYVGLNYFSGMEGTLLAQDSGRSYFFSSLRGNDANSGTSPDAPWRSMDKLQQLIPTLKPGDIVCLERGSVWNRSVLGFRNISGTSADPIVITSYGQGSEPVISGSMKIESWTSAGNNRYYAVNSQFPDLDEEVEVPQGLFVNGQRYSVSREPDREYFFSTSGDGSKEMIGDNSKNWKANQWVNAQGTVKGEDWDWYDGKIASNTGNTLRFDGNNLLEQPQKSNRLPYFINNHLNAINLDFEWACTLDTVYVKLPKAPSNYSIEMPVEEIGITIDNCSNLRFENLDIGKYNLMAVYIKNASHVYFNRCSIHDAGSDLIYTRSSSLDIRGCSFFNGNYHGITLDYSNKTRIIGNTFRRIGHLEGETNPASSYYVTGRGVVAITNYYENDTMWIEQNLFDSVTIAYQTHIANSAWYFRYNLIKNYGLSTGDNGAVYCGGDWQQQDKQIKKNIILDVSDKDADYINSGHMGKHTHAIYYDYSTSYVVADSNSILNANTAIYFHVCNENKFRYNNMYNVAQDLLYPWAAGIFFDEYSYQWGEGKIVAGNEIMHNNLVFGPVDKQNETGNMYHHCSSIGGNRMDYNNYFDPFLNAGENVNMSGRDYGNFVGQSLSSWASSYGQENHSTLNRANWDYTRTTGISKDEFVRFEYNWSDRDTTINLVHEYVDMEGKTVNKVTIPPYYSCILFLKGKSALTNNLPVIQNQTFEIRESDLANTLIGRINASDADADQLLNFAITSGNRDNTFRLDQTTGLLSWNRSLTDIEQTETFILTVRVTDNGAPVLSSAATCTIRVVPVSRIVYIDPSVANGSAEDGSEEHPYNSWTDVKWTDGYSYLQKRNTVCDVEKININASSVTLGAYGDGDLPLIRISSENYLIRAYDRSNVTIQNLHIQGNNALSCVYFLGEACDNNVIEYCRFEGTESAIRIIDGKRFVIRYNTFVDHVDAVYSYAETTELYYNLFLSNYAAISVPSSMATTTIYNNVFYDNNQGVAASFSDLVLYNNIFYMTGKSDQAINHKMDNLISDHNIFYPENDGFISIKGVEFNSLEEYKSVKGLDLNSFSADPQFVDIYNENFSLSAVSPAIDAGRNLGLLVDFFGTQVPTGGAPDIGMGELTNYVPGMTPVNDTEEASENITVYPNPSRGLFNISISLPENCQEGILYIRDRLGKIVENHEISFQTYYSELVDISNAATGIYFITVETGGKMFTEKLVKQ